MEICAQKTNEMNLTMEYIRCKHLLCSHFTAVLNAQSSFCHSRFLWFWTALIPSPARNRIHNILSQTWIIDLPAFPHNTIVIWCIEANCLKYFFYLSASFIVLFHSCPPSKSFLSLILLSFCTNRIYSWSNAWFSQHIRYHNTVNMGVLWSQCREEKKNTFSRLVNQMIEKHCFSTELVAVWCETATTKRADKSYKQCIHVLHI